ncbi:MAG TPA: hypothetical protein VHC63_01990 [Acidimicrobiales bacterium]|nr:hypothetical protein [Acidimicrobiales bacterium]
MATETERRVYTPELKAEALELCRAGEPHDAVAALLDVPEPIVRMWVLREQFSYAGEANAKPTTTPAPAAKPAVTPRPTPDVSADKRCMVCGRGPALDATLRSVTGIVIAFRMRRIRGTFCHDCGVAMARRWLNRTLLTGWWGLFSGFANFYAIGVDANDLSRFRRLAAPTGEPVKAPLAVGKPMFQRVGVYAAGLLLLVSSAIGVLGVLGSQQLPSAYAGKCVAFAPKRLVRQPDCSGAHDGRVVAVVSGATLCPPVTDATLRLKVDKRKQLCIDLDQ